MVNDKFSHPMYHTLQIVNIPPTTEISYNKEPKSVTAFDLFTFFRADLIQSETS